MEGIEKKDLGPSAASPLRGAARLKFRAWDHLSKEMYDLIEVRFRHGKAMIGFLDNPSWGARLRDLSEITIMQWTGLLDKHGREIYEGDILQRHAGEASVYIRFNQEHSRFEAKGDSGISIWALSTAYCAVREVVGNTYENPELLK